MPIELSAGGNRLNLVLSTGYISGGIEDAIPNGKSSKCAFGAERGMFGDGNSKSDLKQSDVACDVTIRVLKRRYSSIIANA